MAKHDFMVKVDGKPFFILGAQAGTNNTYHPGGLTQFWRASDAMHLNTAELQVFWELVEPEEGKFDFTQVDRLIAECEAHGVKMVLIWFAVWKNGCMKYAPKWVKTDKARFPRVVSAAGVETLNLSTFYPEAFKADCRAFCALMAHLKETDVNRTVICVQVENESGIFGPTVRDHSPAADAVFNAPVPEALVDYIAARPGSDVYAAWAANGQKRGEAWEATFGRDAAEFFTAYAIASFIGNEAAAGKQVYDIPMYANVWMQKAGFEQPGVDYPSGGPVGKVLDIWKFAAPALDCIAPDNYCPHYPGFTLYCNQYDREDNLLFIPESPSQTAGNWQPFAAIAEHDCQGYSCMGHMYDIVAEDGTAPEGRMGIIQSFRDLADVAPVLPDYYGTGNIHAIIQHPGMIEDMLFMRGWNARVSFTNGKYAGNVVGNFINAHKPEGAWGAGLVLQAGDNEFYIVGNDFTVEFRKAIPADCVLPEQALVRTTQTIDYLVTEEGYFDRDGQFVVFNTRNGDSNDYGVVVMPRTRVMHVVLNP